MENGKLDDGVLCVMWAVLKDLDVVGSSREK